MMKAAVLKEIGTIPVYLEVDEPIPENDDQILVNVKTSSIKQLDLIRASGQHYTKYPSFPVVVGIDGVAQLENGQRVYAMGVGMSGMMAEKALVQKNTCIPIPDELSNEMAAVLPNFLVGSDLALRVRAQIKKGDTVLIHGATGHTGMLAVQMAKYHGAKTIIVTGRNSSKLDLLKKLGADITISLNQPSDEVIRDLKNTYTNYPFDIVIDYLWGQQTEYLLQALFELPSQKMTKIVTVGSMAGKHINHIASENLRSKDIVLIGSGIGSISQKILGNYMHNNLPEIFQYAATGALFLETNYVELANITPAWQSNEITIVNI